MDDNGWQVPLEVIIEDGLGVQKISNVQDSSTKPNPGAEPGDKLVQRSLRKKKRSSKIIPVSNDKEVNLSHSTDTMLERTLTPHGDTVHSQCRGNEKTCVICKKEFSRVDHYKRHLKTHTGGLSFQCQYCGYRSYRADHLQRHMKRRHGLGVSHRDLKAWSSEQHLVDSFQCHEPPTNGMHLDNDVKIEPTGDYWPDYASFTFSAELEQGSVQDSKSSRKCHQCPVCGRKFTRIDNLERHARFHSGESPFECRSCDYRTHRTEHLQKHMKRNHGEIVSHKELMRSIKQLSTNPEIAEVHNREGTCSIAIKLEPSSESSSLCSDPLGMSITNSFSLQESSEKINEHGEELICSFCGKTFTRSNKKPHDGADTEERSLACDLCDYKSNFADRQVKCRRNQSGKELDACHSWSVTMDNGTDVTFEDGDDGPIEESVEGIPNVQDSSINSNPEPDLGDQVAQRSFQKKKLSKMGNGENRKRVRGRSLASNGHNLKTCTICHKQFGRSEHYKRHLKTHTGELPFPCQHCGYRSYRSDHVQKHMKRCHKVGVGYGDLVVKSSDLVNSEGESFERKESPMNRMNSENGVKIELTGDYWLNYASFTSSAELEQGPVQDSKSSRKCHQCKVCGRKFSRVFNLERHARFHSRESLFECRSCDYRSYRSEHMQKHMKKNHGELVNRKELMRSVKQVPTSPKDVEVQNREGTYCIDVKLEPSESSMVCSDSLGMFEAGCADRQKKCTVNQSSEDLEACGSWSARVAMDVAAAVTFKDGDDGTVEESVEVLIDDKISLGIQKTPNVQDSSSNSNPEPDLGEQVTQQFLRKRKRSSGVTTVSNGKVGKRVQGGTLAHDRHTALNQCKGKQIMCTICNKQFGRLDHYKRHLKTHTGELPFPCQHCGYRSYRADHVQRHMKRCHKVGVSYSDLAKSSELDLVNIEGESFQCNESPMDGMNLGNDVKMEPPTDHWPDYASFESSAEL